MKPISRREMLGKTGWLGATAAVGSPLGTSLAQEKPREAPANPKLKLVFTGGHPGNPEAHYTNAGHEVVLLYLNRGDPAETPSRKAGGGRIAEAAKACEILKARPAFASQIDGRAVVDRRPP